MPGAQYLYDYAVQVICSIWDPINKTSVWLWWVRKKSPLAIYQKIWSVYGYFFLNIIWRFQKSFI